MNFKKTLVSLVAVSAMALTLGSPLVAAQDASRPVTSSVNEDGDLTYGFKGNPISFTVSVDTNTSADAGPVFRAFVFNDTHASSPGFNLQITADDFTTAGGYTIDNANLSIGKRAPGPGANLCPLSATEPANVGGNTFQTITALSTHVPATTPLSGSVMVLNGTAGRGCGELDDLGVSYFLHVPAGTYTGGGTAVYTTNLVLTNTLGGGPAEPGT